MERGVSMIVCAELMGSIEAHINKTAGGMSGTCIGSKKRARLAVHRRKKREEKFMFV